MTTAREELAARTRRARRGGRRRGGRDPEGCRRRRPCRGPALVLATTAFLLAAAPRLEAQEPEELRIHEHLDFDRPEAWALKYFASTSLLSGFGPVAAAAPGSVTVGLEVDPIPAISDQDAQVGFAGSKQEDVNKAPVLVRPRLEVGLGDGWVATVAWVPPVEAFGVEANLLSAALGRSTELAGGWRLGGRLFAQTGSLTTDVTCPRQVAARGADPEGNPFGCEAPSSDEVTLRYAGFELATSWGDVGEGGHRLVPFFAVAANYLDLAFHVDALTNGLHDRTRLTAHGTTWSAAGGARYRFGRSSELAAEVFYTPLSVRRPGADRVTDDPLLNARTLLVYHWR